MVAQNVAFGILAVAMVLAAIGVVRTQNVVHAALYLVVVLAGAAAQYILLAAEFVAWVQVLIYIGAVVILFFLPWLDKSAVKSIRYRPSWHLYVYAVFVVNFIVLAYLGVQPPSPVGERVSQVGTLYYFGFFLLMPWWSSMGDTKPVPARVTFAPH